MTSIKHVAIIMDGNGRWAQSRFRPRVWGHVRGSHRVSEIVEKADDLGIESLTLYAFSTENWSRPIKEVTTLLKLLKKFLSKERERIIKNKVKFKIIGERQTLPKEILYEVEKLENETRDFKGLKLNFAFSYGSRNELINAINSTIKKNPGQTITQKMLEESLYAPEIKEIDLLIRTGGDIRVSNFLLWQIAYAELFFTPILWPDFSADFLTKIIEEVSSRQRRFGGLSGQSKLESIEEEAQKQKSLFQLDQGAK